jgi:hypothetical protein
MWINSRIPLYQCKPTALLPKREFVKHSFTFTGHMTLLMHSLKDRCPSFSILMLKWRAFLAFNWRFVVCLGMTWQCWSWRVLCGMLLTLRPSAYHVQD